MQEESSSWTSPTDWSLAVRDEENPSSWGSTHDPRNCRRGSWTASRRAAGDRRRACGVRMRGHRRRRPARRRRQVPVGVLRSCTGRRGSRASVRRSNTRSGKASVLFDGKRNDIGSTAEAYARAYLGKVPVGDAFEPAVGRRRDDDQPLPGDRRGHAFVKIAAREHKGVFVLVRTSNASAGEFQDLVAGGQAALPARRQECWTGPLGTRGVGISPGRRGRRGDVPPRSWRSSAPPCRGSSLLVPGYGAQGGSSPDVASASTRMAWGRSSTIHEGSRSPMRDRRIRLGSATTGTEPSSRPSTT